MKKLFIAVLLLSAKLSYAQWTNTNTGNLIYTTTGGSVGIGTSTPSTTSNYRILSLNSSVANDYGGLIDFKKDNVTKSAITGDDGSFSFWSATGIPMRFFHSGIEMMTILPDGKTGFGHITPRTRLEVAPPPGDVPAAIFRLNGSQAFGHVLTLSTDNVAGDDARLMFSYRAGAKNWALGGSNQSTNFSIWENPKDNLFNANIDPNGPGIGTPRLTVFSGGNVGIGTNDTKGYKLAVAGSFIAERVEIKLQGSWPDYVFRKGHRLMSLSEVKAFIDKNQHLPEMPSEAEVAEKGINVGEMNKLLTKKVEELTLYLIEKEKELQAEKALNQKQEERLKKLEDLIKK